MATIEMGRRDVVGEGWRATGWVAIVSKVLILSLSLAILSHWRPHDKDDISYSTSGLSDNTPRTTPAISTRPTFVASGWEVLQERYLSSSLTSSCFPEQSCNQDQYDICLPTITTSLSTS